MTYIITDELLRGKTTFGKAQNTLDGLYAIQSHAKGKKNCQEIRRSVSYAIAWMKEVEKDLRK